jgi:glycosyltransferase involved in cell wall biosynthesis
MTGPLVSVVMPVCNADRFLAQAIESVLGQNFVDFEFIVVDYGSTDNSKPIISSYAGGDSRIKFHEVPPCVLPAARNAGCFLARGRYIAVMDADDVSLPDRLSREVGYMESHPQVALLGGAVEWVDPSGRPFHVFRHPTESGKLKSEMATHCTFWHPTVIVRTEAFRAVGGYRPAFVCAHDYDLELRLAEKFDCANLEEIVLKYRVHPWQLTFDRQRLQTLCKLAAQASAAARSTGQPDPLDALQEITPSVLDALGIDELVQRSSVVTDGHIWIRNMITAGDYAAALAAARRILESNLDQVDPWQVSELHVLVARLYWRDKKFWRYILAAGRAVLVRPILIGRPLKPLLHKLGLV